MEEQPSERHAPDDLRILIRRNDGRFRLGKTDGQAQDAHDDDRPVQRVPSDMLRRDGRIIVGREHHDGVERRHQKKRIKAVERKGPAGTDLADADHVARGADNAEQREHHALAERTELRSR
ncbi:MAG: hypothetical protein DI626_01945 [Micavibrio aeruginosavorus]|uniref:Uncharacterized protein n=1 Tax=Micavibrio aeruginosavorus TaxID=349221 RepID=A0A2W5BZ53_9BACT|nr:MAG: hypothetical protein DI626_01945 [Micavibrio aeruginosavorus]